MALLIIYY